MPGAGVQGLHMMQLHSCCPRRTPALHSAAAGSPVRELAGEHAAGHHGKRLAVRDGQVDNELCGQGSNSEAGA